MTSLMAQDKISIDDDRYMNDHHLEYFRKKLLVWRDEILKGSNQTLQMLREEDNRIPDLSDWASAEIERGYQLRARDRERKLLAKIEAALRKIDERTYGFCEETYEPIGFNRLDARPIATLCIEAQERHEQREKVYREH